MKKSLRNIKMQLIRALDTLRLPWALLMHHFTGKSASWAGVSMINAFCLTGGRSNDWLSALISLRYPPKVWSLEKQVLTPLSASSLQEVTGKLRRQGYVILDQKVPQEICDELMAYAYQEAATPHQSELVGSVPQKAVYDPMQPRAVLYNFDKETVLAHPRVQSLLMDPVILDIAQAYLGSEPIADMISMWWSTAYKSHADGEAAQLYHFDLDRLKWLKFFIYLTDVDHDNGPHMFVSGSHRSGGIPGDLLGKGYVRLEDEEIESHYRPEDIVEVTAPRGAILVEDTRGLHKGQHVRHGHRLLLQFQYSNSRFGAETERGKLVAAPSAPILACARQYPRVYSGYQISG